jgi:hypothetical protein
LTWMSTGRYSFIDALTCARSGVPVGENSV